MQAMRLQTLATVAASLGTSGGDEEELWVTVTRLALLLPQECYKARCSAAVPVAARVLSRRRGENMLSLHRS